MADGSGADALPLADPAHPTALEALRPLASTEVTVTPPSTRRPSLSHREVYTSRGLLTVLRHQAPTAMTPHPPEASHVVAAIAGHGDVEILSGDGHLLAKSDDIIVERLDAWLAAVLELPTAR